MSDRVYLDHASTTPILPVALDAMAAACATWANPLSPHKEGRQARAALEDARRRIALALDWQKTLVFTSGATEAIAIGFRQAKARSFVVSAIEHSAVLRHAADARTIAVLAEGMIDLADLEEALDTSEVPLVAVQHVNSETGVIQPVDTISKLVRDAGGIFFCDCAQSAGKLPLPPADLISIAAHKLGGPPGVGALLVRDPSLLSATGGQEGGLRPGTPAGPSIAGFAAAMEADRGGWYESAGALRAKLDHAVTALGGQVVAGTAPRIATIASYRMPGVPAAAQLMQFDLAGIAVSAGSACSSGSIAPSHVLAAMGWDDTSSREVIRVSFGPATCDDHVQALLDQWSKLAQKQQAA